MPKIPPRPDEITGPSVRLALGADIIKTVGDQALNPPNVRLAHVPGAQGDNNLLGQRGIEQLPQESRPALLVSYIYLKPFLANKYRYAYRDWVLDSGAFSAHNSGVEIDLQEYIDCCKQLIAEDPTLTEVFALDVIGDWKASVANCEEMWRQGVPAIPCFHYGSPWEVLRELAQRYPKIALGGCVGKRDKDKFAGQCFARVWPHKLHGFGFGSEKSIMMFPWHSVDATNWELAPCKYGQWKAFGTQRVSVRGSRQNLRAEVEWYLDLERRARERWKKEMEKLEVVGPNLQLGLARVQTDASGNIVQRTIQALESPSIALGPTVRLIGAADDTTDRRGVAFSRPGEEQLKPHKRPRPRSKS